MSHSGNIKSVATLSLKARGCVCLIIGGGGRAGIDGGNGEKGEEGNPPLDCLG